MTNNHSEFSTYPKTERHPAEIYWNGDMWVVDKDKTTMSFKSFKRALAWAELNEEETNHE